MKIWEGGGGETRKSTKVISGDHFSEVAFKGGDGPNFTLFSTKSSDPPPGDKKMTGPLHNF